MKMHMNWKRLVTALLVVIVAAPTASAQQKPGKKNAADKLRGAQVEIYKNIGDVKLKMHIFKPAHHKPAEKRPAIVFFFGGGWKNGTPSQFVNHCRYLASRGMVAMAADYRVYSRHQVKVTQCVADAKSAIRWVRSNASRLGIDPNRIAAGGGSAGGHLAAAVGTLDGFDEPDEDTSVSSRPNALVLFNPALNLAAEAFSPKFQKNRYPEIEARLGTEPKNISPTHHVKRGVPPTILFHGINDTTVPFAQAKEFSKAMQAAGNRCELVGAQGEEHGFFNFGRKKNKPFIETLTKADRFLVSLGYLKGEPSVERFLKNAD